MQRALASSQVQTSSVQASNFHLSFIALPKTKREAMAHFYQFCRYADDLVDEVKDPQEAALGLAHLREEVDRAFENGGQPQTPLGLRLEALRRKFPVKKQNFVDIIDGCEMDLKQSRYENFEALRQYCYRVASAVGLVSIEIFGYSEKSTLEYAVQMGLAFQWTNILRDVREDAERGRIYLPLDEMARFGYTVEDLRARKATPAFFELMRFQIERAKGFYTRSAQLLSETDRSRMLAAEMMASVYFAILRHIERDPSQVLQRRLRVSTPRKIWLSFRTWMRGRRI